MLFLFVQPITELAHTGLWDFTGSKTPSKTNQMEKWQDIWVRFAVSAHSRFLMLQTQTRISQQLKSFMKLGKYINHVCFETRCEGFKNIWIPQIYDSRKCSQTGSLVDLSVCKTHLTFSQREGLRAPVKVNREDTVFI